MFQANLKHAGSELARLRRTVRHGARAQRARLMLIAASICAFAMIGVSATVLSALF